MRSLKAAAAVAAAAAACHLALAGIDPAHPLMIVTMVVLTGLCLPCAVTLWRRPTEHAATAMLFMSVVMILAHTASLSTHEHGSTASLAGAPAVTVFTIAPLLLELAVTLQLACWLRRRHQADARTETVHTNREVTEPQ
ncbi:MAG TPA: hypothetical protein VGI08_12035 [Diaminobutyricibacter sp.]